MHRRLKPVPGTALLLTAYLAFIGLGLPDAVTGVIWPSIRDTFSRDQSGLGLVLTCSAAGYLTSSFFAGSLMRVLNLGTLLVLCSALVTLALCGYATTGLWPVFLLCAVALGLGGGAIDAAINHFVATHFGGRHLNWLHAFYGLGAALGPLILTTTLAGGWSWRTGIGLIAGVLGTLTLIYVMTRDAWRVDEPEVEPAGKGVHSEEVGGKRGGDTILEALRLRAVWLSMAAFFAVTGLEATAGQWTFTLFTESRGMSTVAAGAWVGAFWSAFTISRVLAGFVVARVGSVRLTRVGALGMVLGAALLALSPTPALGGVGLVLVGFSIAPLFPGLMAETPRRLGAEAARHAVGFQVSAAILGAAAIPAMAGLLADRFGLEVVALAPLVAGLLFIAVHETLIATTDRAT